MTDKNNQNELEQYAIRKLLFEFIHEYMMGDRSHKLDIAHILLYKNPYKSRIVFNTSPDDLTCELRKVSDVDERETTACGYYLDRKITLVDENCGNLLSDLFNTIGHEYTHYLQSLMIEMRYNKKANQSIKLSTKAVQMLDTLERTYDSQSLLYALKYAVQHGQLDEQQIEKDYQSFVKERPAQAQSMSHECYMQLLYEENARDCGFEFAREMITSLMNDPLCGIDTIAYLDTCLCSQKNLWELEQQNRDYQALQKNFTKEMDKLGKLSFEKILSIQDPVLKNQLLQNKLFMMRKAKTSTRQYLRALSQLPQIFLDSNAAAFLRENKRGVMQSLLVLDSMPLIARCMQQEVITQDDVCILFQRWAKQGAHQQITSLIQKEEKTEEEQQILKTVMTDKKLKKIYDKQFKSLLQMIEKGDVSTLVKNSSYEEVSDQVRMIIDTKQAFDRYHQQDTDKFLYSNTKMMLASLLYDASHSNNQNE